MKPGNRMGIVIGVNNTLRLQAQFFHESAEAVPIAGAVMGKIEKICQHPMQLTPGLQSRVMNNIICRRITAFHQITLAQCNISSCHIQRSVKRRFSRPVSQSFNDNIGPNSRSKAGISAIPATTPLSTRSVSFFRNRLLSSNASENRSCLSRLRWLSSLTYPPALFWLYCSMSPKSEVKGG